MKNTYRKYRKPLRESYHGWDWQSLVLVDIPVTDFRVNNIEEDGATWSCKVSKGYVDFWQIQDDNSYTSYLANTEDIQDNYPYPYIDFTDKSYREVEGGYITGYLDRDAYQQVMSYDDESFDVEKPFDEKAILSYLGNYFKSGEGSRYDGTAHLNMWHNAEGKVTIASNDYWGNPAYLTEDGHIIFDADGDHDYNSYDPRYYKGKSDDDNFGIYVMEADVYAPTIVKTLDWYLDNYDVEEELDDDFEESCKKPSRKVTAIREAGDKAYYVYVKETTYASCLVRANNAEEAMRKAKNATWEDPEGYENSKHDSVYACDYDVENPKALAKFKDEDVDVIWS